MGSRFLIQVLYREEGVIQFYFLYGWVIFFDNFLQWGSLTFLENSESFASPTLGINTDQSLMPISQKFFKSLPADVFHLASKT